MNFTIVGTGRLGLCFALTLARRKNVGVVGHDVSSEYVRQINTAELKSLEPEVEMLLNTDTIKDNFKATTDLQDAVNFSKYIWVFVPTPSCGDSYDHTILTECLQSIQDIGVTNKIIIIGCTVLPGYIDNIAKKVITNNKIVYNPSFIAQGTIISNLENPDVILIGGDEEDVEEISDIYTVILGFNKKLIHGMSAISAEIAKLSLNCFITTKISFANMIGHIAQQSAGADVNAILNAIGSDSRVGNKCLAHGFGYGGPCFPRDNRALSTYAQSLNIDPIISLATDEFNNIYVHYIADKLIKQSDNNSMYHPGLTKSPVIVEGVNYKPNCNLIMLDESHALKVAKEIINRGYPVIIRDRSNVLKEVEKQYGNIFSYLPWDC